MAEPEQLPAIDFLLIADRAEAINGKLYLMGGAWDSISIADLNAPITFSLALGILIPWHATNERHRMRLVVQSAAGLKLAELDGELVAGRPPHLEAGTQQRLLFATNFGIVLPHAGPYAIIVYLNEREAKRTGFTVQVGNPGQGGPPLPVPPIPMTGPPVA